MKKGICYFLASLLLLNTLGYYPVYLCMQWKAQAEFSRQLENNMIGDEEFYTIRLAVDLPPYWNPELALPERIEGQIFAAGEFYKLYKQSISQDSLTILCVKDHAQKHLLDTLTDWVRFTMTGLPGTSEDALQFVSALYKHYCTTKSVIVFFLFSLRENTPLPTPSESSTSEYSWVHSPPPELFS